MDRLLKSGLEVIDWLIDWLLDFNSNSTSLGLFYAKRLGNHIHWTFVFTFFMSFFLDSFEDFFFFTQSAQKI